MLTKPVTFVIISILVVVLIHSSYFISNAAAAPKVTRGPIECNNILDNDLIRCCQDETDSKGITITWCVVCDNTAPPSNCGPRAQDKEQPPAPTPTGPGIGILPGDKVLDELTTSPSPTPPPSSGKGVFGSDVPTLSVSPDGGSTNDGGKVVEQSPTIPTAPTTPPAVSSPETEQGDGDKKPPPVKDLPDIDITQQPEVQQQEQGDQPSNEGQGPAGPLT
jgi:hypothetical protein